MTAAAPSPAALALLNRIEADLSALRALLDVPETEPVPEPEEWLEPCTVAGRLGVGEQYVRKLCRAGARNGEPGVKREGGRWFATVDAIDRLRRV